MNWLKKEQEKNYKNYENILNSTDVEGNGNAYVSGWSDYNDSNEMGFSVTTGNEWGHIDGNLYTICAVTPSICGR